MKTKFKLAFAMMLIPAWASPFLPQAFMFPVCATMAIGLFILIDDLTDFK